MMMIYTWFVRVCTLDQEMMDISKIATSFLSFLTESYVFSFFFFLSFSISIRSWFHFIFTVKART